MMSALKSVLSWIKKCLVAQKSKRTLEPGTYIPKRFPFLWLCLVLAFSRPVFAEEPIVVQLEGPTAEEYIQTAKASFYSLPSEVVEYTTYPLMFRLRNLQLREAKISAKLESSLEDHSGNKLPGAQLDWVQGTWIWEGREDEGPAPGLQFTALLPVLSPPGCFEAKLLVTLSDGLQVLSEFPVTLSLEVPRWAACLNSPKSLQLNKKSLGNSGHYYLESENLNFLIAANTNWALWLSSELFTSTQYVANGGSTIPAPSGYIAKHYSIREPLKAEEEPNLTEETTLDIILKY